MKLKILILKRLRLEKIMKFQKVNILETHMKLLVELKKIKGEEYSINNVSEGGYEKNNKDKCKGNIGAIEASYSKEDKNRYERGINIAHKKGETKVRVQESYTKG